MLSVHLEEVLPGEDREADALHEGGQVLAAARQVVAHPRQHRFVHLLLRGNSDRVAGDQLRNLG